MSTDPAAVRAGYRWCRRLARSHYENFPVASLLLPARLRDPVAAIYAFARSADDIADEGDESAPQRLARLDEMNAAIAAIAAGRSSDGPLYTALADSVTRHRLPLQPLHDLLDAFRQDVLKARYRDFDELMDYCRRSANPVGRLLLHLDGVCAPDAVRQSDALCTALQLINFLQDLPDDYRQRGRLYLPTRDLADFGVSEADIAGGRNTAGVQALVRLQIERASRLLQAGSPLAARLRGRFALELRAIVLGATRTLDKLRDRRDVFSRPRLGRRDRAAIFWRALAQGLV